jgi:hypothetical protein
MTFSFKDNLEASRQSINRSRSASERAKEFIDAGYIKRQERDLAVEELRLGVEYMVEALDLLETRIRALEKKPSIIRRRI